VSHERICRYTVRIGRQAYFIGEKCSGRGVRSPRHASEKGRSMSNTPIQLGPVSTDTCFHHRRMPKTTPPHRCDRNLTDGEKERRIKQMYTVKSAQQMHAPPKPTAMRIYEVLEPNERSTPKPCFGRRILSRKIRIVPWALRIYVLLIVLL
jgi:hypothetical protein